MSGTRASFRSAMRRSGGARERALSPAARPAPTPWRTRTREKSRPPWGHGGRDARAAGEKRSEEHTSELQSLMRNSYAVFCLKKKKTVDDNNTERTITTTP